MLSNERIKSHFKAKQKSFVYGFEWVTLPGVEPLNKEIKKEIDRKKQSYGVFVNTQFSRQIGFAPNGVKKGLCAASIYANYTASTEYLNENEHKGAFVVARIDDNFVGIVVAHLGSIFFDAIISSEKLFEEISSIYTQIGIDLNFFITNDLSEVFDKNGYEYNIIDINSISLPNNKASYLIHKIKHNSKVKIAFAILLFSFLFLYSYYSFFTDDDPPQAIQQVTQAVDPAVEERKRKEEASKKAYDQWWVNFNKTPMPFEVVRNCMNNTLSFPVRLAGWNVKSVKCLSERATILLDRTPSGTFEKLLKYFPNVVFPDLDKANVIIDIPLAEKFNREYSEQKLPLVNEEWVQVGSLGQTFQLMKNAKVTIKKPFPVSIPDFIGKPWQQIDWRLDNTGNLMSAEFVRLINNPNVVVDEVEMLVTSDNSIVFKITGKTYAK